MYEDIVYVGPVIDGVMVIHSRSPNDFRVNRHVLRANDHITVIEQNGVVTGKRMNEINERDKLVGISRDAIPESTTRMTL